MQDQGGNQDDRYGYQVISQHYPNLISTLHEEDPLLAKSLQGSLIRPHKVTGKSRNTSLILCFLLGIFGAHRFYVGKKLSGTLMLISFGGVGLWTLIDMVMIFNGSFEDHRGNPLY